MKGKWVHIFGFCFPKSDVERTHQGDFTHMLLVLMIWCLPVASGGCQWSSVVGLALPIFSRLYICGYLILCTSSSSSSSSACLNPLQDKISPNILHWSLFQVIPAKLSIPSFGLVLCLPYLLFSYLGCHSVTLVFNLLAVRRILCPPHVVFYFYFNFNQDVFNFGLLPNPWCSSPIFPFYTKCHYNTF